MAPSIQFLPEGDTSSGTSYPVTPAPEAPKTAEHAYNDTLRKLNLLDTNFAYRQRAIKTDNWDVFIEDMLRWCRAAGYESPDFDPLNAVHIAGSKGKGSTSAFIFSILSEYQSQESPIQKLGLYTSPHLRTVRERIRISPSKDMPFYHTPLSEEQFVQYFSDVWERLGLTDDCAKGGPPFARFLTLVALHGFLQEKVDTAVVEVCLGGRHDSTNVLHRPSVCAITSLALEHTDLLGDTIEEIAWAKGGIIKPGVPVFTIPQKPGATRTLQKIAAEQGAELTIVPVHPEVETMELGLAGEFQKINASLAIAVAASHLRRMGYSGIPENITSAPLPEKFRRALRNASWPGRCETRDCRSGRFLLDGAHTVESMDLVGSWFAKKAAQHESSKRVLIFNQQTRDAFTLVRHLRDSIRRSATGAVTDVPFHHVIFCTNIAWEKNEAADMERASMIFTGNSGPENLTLQTQLSGYWRGIPGEEMTGVTVVRTVEEAVRCAGGVGGVAGKSPLVLITGSLHLIGSASEVLETLEEEGVHL
ncbi:FolC bifunctional protein [Aspergillus sclerotiicarbonarius CBS 121057]|uniref:Folylpolyglutamate synthase n=1 Tax=Aspergillus sclerotiicarbonarius (strain CBS 121057 / IBT 28362) TaxID=1448318 RepID=A0A319DXT0_ASPSB|nr:FolC bifunctional protein [Aspergillus sclerotiicarbonarius CBS 121057]